MEWHKIAVFCLFVILSVLVRLAQHGARTVKYNFLCPIIAVSFVKLASSLVLFSVNDASLASIPGKLLAARGLVVRYTVVAAGYCTYDVLSFVNLGRFDPQTYLMILQLRTVCVGFLWEIAFEKPQSWVQRGGLCLICMGCLLKQLAAPVHDSSLPDPTVIDYVLIFIQVSSNLVAGVASELLLKRGQFFGSADEVPLNLQGVVQYTWIVIGCLTIGIVCPAETIHLNPFDLEEWAIMTDPLMLANIMALSALGLVTAVMLKKLNSIWKAIGTASELFFTSLASMLVFGYPVASTDIIAMWIACFGVCLYAGFIPSCPPPSLLPSSSKTQGKPKYLETNTDVEFYRLVGRPAEAMTGNGQAA